MVPGPQIYSGEGCNCARFMWIELKGGVEIITRLLDFTELLKCLTSTHENARRPVRFHWTKIAEQFSAVGDPSGRMPGTGEPASKFNAVDTRNGKWCWITSSARAAR